MVEYKNILISAADKLILKAEDFIIEPKKIIFITGDSGIGKSLFMKYLAGVIDFHENIESNGEVIFDKINIISHLDFYTNSDDFVYIGQDVENFVTGIFCEDEIACSIKADSYEESVEKAREFLLKFNKNLIGRRIGTLSQGELQELILFGAIISKKKYIFLDEPFARLDRFERKKIASLIKKITEENNTSFIISGHGVETIYLDFENIFKIENQKIIIENKTNILSKLYKHKIKREKIYQQKDILVQFENLDYSIEGRKILENFSGKIYKGEITSFTGLNGAGKTTLAKILCGDKKIQKGKISNIINNVVFIDKNPDFHFLFNNLEQEIESTLDNTENNIFEKLGLNPKSNYRQLSFGQKMRFLMLLYSNMEQRDVFIFDESFSGQDSNGINLLIEIFMELKRKGKSIIVIGQDNFYFRGFCDKTIYIKKYNEKN